MPDSSPSPETSAPKQVSRFEANLLRILRYFFHQVPGAQALTLVMEAVDRPPCLSAAAVHLVRDTLSKGCVLYLVRAGGWKRLQFLRNGAPKFGRLWERTDVAELTLRFSTYSLEFLLWLTSTKVPAEKTPWSAPIEKLTVGDWVLLFLAYEGLRIDSDVAGSLRLSPIFVNHPLCRLAYPDDFADEKPLEVPSFNTWLTGPGSYILEAIQAVLEKRWLEIERGKGQIGDWTLMRQQGQAQLNVLERFVVEVEASNRPDLARFLLQVLGRVLTTQDMAPTFWTGGLQGTGPPWLADRLETQRNALALLRHAGRFRQWQQRAQTRGYFDEDYAAGKFWLSQWEALNGEQVVRRAEHVVQLLEPLRPTT